MQAFRAATTIDEERQLHLSAIPFRPGTAVDVIVLERSPARSQGGPADRQRQGTCLATEQYRLAGHYPEEYVVLVGERIVHHCSDRQQAIQAYQRAAVDDPSNRPVIVSPGEQPRKPLLVRGRTLTGKHDGLR